MREHHTTLLTPVGKKLRSGKRHDGRAPDYDDWDLNGDILLWSGAMNRAVEISSMGIRVSPESLDRQLTEAGCDARRTLDFRRALLAGELPLTVGGGSGTSGKCRRPSGMRRPAPPAAPQALSCCNRNIF